MFALYQIRCLFQIVCFGNSYKLKGVVVFFCCFFFSTECVVFTNHLHVGW